MYTQLIPRHDIFYPRQTRVTTASFFPVYATALHEYIIYCQNCLRRIGGSGWNYGIVDWGIGGWMNAYIINQTFPLAGSYGGYTPRCHHSYPNLGLALLLFSKYEASPPATSLGGSYLEFLLLL